MYHITTDTQRHRISVTFSGSLSADQLRSFERDLQAAAVPAKAGGAWFDMIVDLTGAGLMTRDVADSSEHTLAWLAANGLRKSANIVGSALLKMQFKRVAGSSGNQFGTFASREEALAWLDAPA